MDEPIGLDSPGWGDLPESVLYLIMQAFVAAQGGQHKRERKAKFTLCAVCKSWRSLAQDLFFPSNLSAWVPNMTLKEGALVMSQVGGRSPIQHPQQLFSTSRAPVSGSRLLQCFVVRQELPAGAAGSRVPGMKLYCYRLYCGSSHLSDSAQLLLTASQTSKVLGVGYDISITRGSERGLCAHLESNLGRTHYRLLAHAHKPWVRRVLQAAGMMKPPAAGEAAQSGGAQHSQQAQQRDLGWSTGGVCLASIRFHMQLQALMLPRRMEAELLHAPVEEPAGASGASGSGEQQQIGSAGGAGTVDPAAAGAAAAATPAPPALEVAAAAAASRPLEVGTLLEAASDDMGQGHPSERTSPGRGLGSLLLGSTTRVLASAAASLRGQMAAAAAGGGGGAAGRRRDGANESADGASVAPLVGAPAADEQHAAVASPSAASTAAAPDAATAADQLLPSGGDSVPRAPQLQRRARAPPGALRPPSHPCSTALLSPPVTSPATAAAAPVPASAPASAPSSPCTSSSQLIAPALLLLAPESSPSAATAGSAAAAATADGFLFPSPCASPSGGATACPSSSSATAYPSTESSFSGTLYSAPALPSPSEQSQVSSRVSSPPSGSPASSAASTSMYPPPSPSGCKPPLKPARAVASQGAAAAAEPTGCEDEEGEDEDGAGTAEAAAPQGAATAAAATPIASVTAPGGSSRGSSGAGGSTCPQARSSRSRTVSASVDGTSGTYRSRTGGASSGRTAAGRQAVSCSGAYPAASVTQPAAAAAAAGAGQQLPVVRLDSKMPVWNDVLHCWCLNFKGRVKVASVKNFQLAHRADPMQQTHLQFGKVTEGVFACDFDPQVVSPLQAFALVISTFERKLFV